MSKSTLRPLGQKSYGSIAHIPGSRMGPGDHACHPGQARIATEKTRDRHDRVICQEKLDGSNVGIAKLNGALVPLTRAGYAAATAPYEQHQHFAHWVYAQQPRFLSLLEDGERVCGEWLMQAHGTRYALPGEPFVAFDLMHGTTRALYEETSARCARVHLALPPLLHYAEGQSFSVEAALRAICPSRAGALDQVEGAVWRVERHTQAHPSSHERTWQVDFLVKYVRPDKQDGQYLESMTGGAPVWNWHCTVCGMAEAKEKRRDH